MQTCKLCGAAVLAHQATCQAWLLLLEAFTWVGLVCLCQVQQPGQLVTKGKSMCSGQEQLQIE